MCTSSKHCLLKVVTSGLRVSRHLLAFAAPVEYVPLLNILCSRSTLKLYVVIDRRVMSAMVQIGQLTRLASSLGV